MVPQKMVDASGIYRPPALWGLILGAGLLTHAPFAAFHMVILMELVAGNAVTGCMFGIAYGFSRGLWALSIAVSGRFWATVMEGPRFFLSLSSVWRLVGSISLFWVGWLLVMSVLTREPTM